MSRHVCWDVRVHRNATNMDRCRVCVCEIQSCVQIEFIESIFVWRDARHLCTVVVPCCTMLHSLWTLMSVECYATSVEGHPGGGVLEGWHQYTSPSLIMHSLWTLMSASRYATSVEGHPSRQGTAPWRWRTGGLAPVHNTIIDVAFIGGH